MTQVVAFDLGGVLVDVDRTRAAKALHVSPSTFDAAAFGAGDRAHHAMSIDGSCAPFLGRIAYELGTSTAAAEQAWASVVSPSPGAQTLVANVIDALGPKSVVAWSNTDPIHAASIRRVLSPLFSPQCALSFEVGSLKPNSLFFRQARFRLGVPFEDILFVDDREENVRTALELGIDAHVVQGVEQCRQVILAAIEVGRK